jgi:hypothetical protein
MENEELELRMYFFVPYNISPIQQAIQAGHSALEYADRYGGEEQFIKFVREHKTWVILDGGTTNNGLDFKGVPLGSMNQILDDLQTNDIQHSIFQEPDLNEALTAICFICDERVFNRKDYPEFVDWILDKKMYADAKEEALKNNQALWFKLKTHPEIAQEMFSDYYKEWVRFLGGVKNVFLRELIKDKKLA